MKTTNMADIAKIWVYRKQKKKVLKGTIDADPWIYPDDGYCIQEDLLEAIEEAIFARMKEGSDPAKRPMRGVVEFENQTYIWKTRPYDPPIQAESAPFNEIKTKLLKWSPNREAERLTYSELLAKCRAIWEPPKPVYHSPEAMANDLWESGMD